MESIVSAAAIIWNLEDKLCVITTGKNKDSRKLWGSYQLELILFLSSSRKLVEFMSDLIKLCVLKMKTGKTWFLVFFSQMFSKIPQSDTCNKFFNVKVKEELHQCVSQKAVSQQCMNLIVIVHI